MTKKEKEEFFEYLKTLPDYKKIIEKYDPDIVYLGGSRGFNTEIGDSDFDIIMYLENKELLPCGYTNINISNDKNWHIHAMIHSIESMVDMLLDTDTYGTIYFAIFGFTANLKRYKENIISKKNSDIINIHLEALSQRANQLALLVAYNLLNKRNRINQLQQFTKDSFMSYKFYYQIILIYDLITDQDHTSLIKRIRNSLNFSDSDFNTINLIFKELLTFYNNYKEKDFISIKHILEVIKWELNKK